MQAMAAGYQSASLLLRLNWDRLLYIAVLATALFGGAAIGSFLVSAAPV